MNDSISAAESLDFLAFRYVVGELTAAETTAFEELLEADQAAREAVAAAVEITAAIQAAGMQPVVAGASDSAGGAASACPHGSVSLLGTASLRDTANLRDTVPLRRWRVIGLWLVGGSLACLGMVALVDHWAAQRLRDAGGDLASGSSGDAASDSVPGQLARLWSETRPLVVGDLAGDSDDPTDMDGVGGLFAAGTGAGEGPTDAAGDGPIDAVADAPSWMIAAVAAKSGAMGDDSAEASMEPTAMPHSSPHVVPDAKPAAGAIP
jgi:hypothetical protein